ncbi:MAG: bifunctional phosphopantothenoylcysteine decarboxylase/phosphopantothenate--cysteine ligase CoaBC [Fimbriimonadales bacterium]|nr:bifunctional phosphopantothenoylcysteine decarboxylase/phosphopantothenate--cysteine ligase CoaBC [Fimbriimonadales bacterium]MDW8051231.1 bifunctional phosphopantothenoylcysteine decarboxylase/phosphopantothenate--cysteine ligase CoaBC [Armatimonadota bacterium]
MPTIVLGVTGSVAAYRAADVARELMRSGHVVRVVMTRAATRLVSPDLFAALTGNPVVVDVFDEPVPGQIAHIRLAQEADLVLIAPATAHTIARLALGLADDMLTTLALATRAPILIAPAMNPAMWAHPAVQAHVRTLQARGVEFIDPTYGVMACGDEGWGKLADTPTIVQAVQQRLARTKDLQGVRVLITAGPTYEPIDPVRFIGNRSSGKMGYAVAEAALAHGAEVVLISGPTALQPPAGTRVVRVQTAQQMHEAVLAEFDACEVFIATAAVADYRPERVLPTKRKRTQQGWTLRLVPNPDILATVAQRKGERIVVGFAAETDKALQHAQQKLRQKNLDLIAVNDVLEPGSGFEVDTNRLTLVYADGRVEPLPLMSKRECAEHLIRAVVHLLQEKRQQ